MSKIYFFSLSTLAALVFCVLATGCTSSKDKANDPKQTLTGYITKSFAIKTVTDRQDLLKYLTGDAKSRLEAWSDDQFHNAFVESKRQFIKLVIPEIRQVSPTETTVTYEISYVDQGRGADAKVTSKKLAQMVYEGDRWLITDVRNIKELIEFKNELSLP